MVSRLTVRALHRLPPPPPLSPPRRVFLVRFSATRTTYGLALFRSHLCERVRPFQYRTSRCRREDASSALPGRGQRRAESLEPGIKLRFSEEPIFPEFERGRWVVALF